VLWEFLRDAYDDFFKLVVLNLLWVVTTLPVVTAPAAIAGLYYAANQMARHEEVDWRTFFEGFRRYWGMGLRWSLLNLLALALMLYNYWFYGQFPAGWAPWVRGLVLGILVLWLMLQAYTFPLLLEQKDRKMYTALRNSMVLYLKRPALALGTALLLAVLVALSTLLIVPWLLFTASTCVYLATRVAVFVVDELSAAATSPPVD
jgi:uncharacterized membrane protein YesL